MIKMNESPASIAIANLLGISKGFEFETFLGARCAPEMPQKVEMRAIACSAGSGVNFAEGRRIEKAQNNIKLTVRNSNVNSESFVAAKKIVRSLVR